MEEKGRISRQDSSRWASFGIIWPQQRKTTLVQDLRQPSPVTKMVPQLTNVTTVDTSSADELHVLVYFCNIQCQLSTCKAKGLIMWLSAEALRSRHCVLLLTRICYVSFEKAFKLWGLILSPLCIETSIKVTKTWDDQSSAQIKFLRNLPDVKKSDCENVNREEAAIYRAQSTFEIIWKSAEIVLRPLLVY